jgi:hypothetical protein
MSFPWSAPVRHLVRTLVIATAMATAMTLLPDVALAQRGGGRGGGGGGGSRGGGGGAAVPRGGHSTGGAPVVGRAVPRGSGPSHPIYGRPGGGYGGYYRPAYGYPYYWGGFGLGWGWGGYWGGYGWGYWGPGWWGPGYASSMWWPGWGWWGGPALYSPPYWGITSNARFLVTPREAEVYVDGALAGIVDQYDGTFQSLTLAPGTHQISLYLDGYRRQDTNVYVAPGSTLKVRHTMEPLAAGAPADERPVLAPRPQQAAAVADDPNGAPTTAYAPRAPRSPRPIVGEAGVLAIRVQPSDAEIFIDGQRWQAPDAKNRPLEVRVPAGRIRVEVRKPGYAPFSTEVTVEPGEITPLNVSLPSQGEKL